MGLSRRIIGLTGGIATGKSTVARYLEQQYRFLILDADLYARDALTPELLQKLGDRYGQQILLTPSTLDRSKLASIIFADHLERQWLESQIHPFVRHKLWMMAQATTAATLVMVIPLLFEANMQDLVTETWVVSCSPAQELSRLMLRDKLDATAAQMRIDSQMPLAQKIAIADFVLDNSGELPELFAQIDKLI